MEFFEWASTAELFMQLFGFSNIYAETIEEALAIVFNRLWWCVGIGAFVYAVCLVFGGIGLSKMAKNAGIAHRWMGFVPILNTYYAGKIAGEAQFFGQKMKRAGLYAAIAEGAYCALSGLNIVSNFLLLPYSKIDIDYSYSEEGVKVIQLDPSRIPQNMRWLYEGNTVIQAFSYILNILLIVFLCVIFIALFRKYYYRSPMLMAILSAVLPFRGFVLFAVRNNKPVDYNEMMRKRMEEVMRRQNPYGQGGYGPNPYGQNGEPQRPPQGGSTPDPFSDFGSSGESGGDHPSSGDDPFSDF